jgi:hypothetical protein
VTVVILIFCLAFIGWVLLMAGCLTVIALRRVFGRRR